MRWLKWACQAPKRLPYFRKQTFSTTRDTSWKSIEVSDEVAEALFANRPVVALESTIITHGMPYPDNINTAEQVELAVRQSASVPATIGIINGRVHVGLNRTQMEVLARAENVVKTSRRDFPIVTSQGLCGGTTVSGTMMIAHRVGITVFVTGGIGGVHRGAESSMDISADLTELGRTPVAVVCAGVKSILDIGRTLEYLETQGVPVIKFGTDRCMPDFFTTSSGYFTPYNVDSPVLAAKAIASSFELGLESGILIAVPIPEHLSGPGALIEAAIQAALQETSGKNVYGKDVTPFVLKRVNELTRGASLKANIGLVLNNAVVGGQIAEELSKLAILRQQSDPARPIAAYSKTQGAKKTFSDKKATNIASQRDDVTAVARRPVVIGGSIMDFNVKIVAEKFEFNGGTYPGCVRQTLGGVGRNLADCLSRQQTVPLFISAVGRDRQGDVLLEHCQPHMDVRGIHRLNDSATATYVATIDRTGHLVLGVGDMDIHDRITPELVGAFESELTEASFVCIDGNVPVPTIEYVTELCSRNSIPVLYEPTDLHKATKILRANHVTYCSPNLAELLALCDAVQQTNTLRDIRRLSALPRDELLNHVFSLCGRLIDRIPNLIVTLGQHGILVCRKARNRDTPFPTRGKLDEDHIVGAGFSATHYLAQNPTLQPTKIISVSGAGDCLIATMVASILRGFSPDLACKAGLKCAQHSLTSFQTVPDDMTSQQYDQSAVSQWAAGWTGTSIQGVSGH